MNLKNETTYKNKINPRYNKNKQSSHKPTNNVNVISFSNNTYA